MSHWYSLGADDARVAELSAVPSGTWPGRVVRAERAAVLVADPAGVRSAGFARHLDPSPTVGDWVAVGEDGVTAVLPRRTAVVRADVGGRSVGQVLAANVDTLLVCAPLVADPPLRLVERLLAVAWSSGGTPVLLATKADLCPPPDAADGLAALTAAAPGVAVLAVSTRDGRGLDGLRALTGPGRTVALLGASGVGKSSLVNALVGADLALTRELRADGKGRHTTAWRELVVLPDGGALVDTPGLRGVGLHGAEDGLARVFADVEDLAARCRFADCAHRGEPGCAVAAALADGTLSAARYDSHLRLQRELAWQEAKADARLRAERHRQWKTVAKAQRARGARP